MEGVAGLEPLLQKLPRLGFGRRRVHCGPLRRKLRSALKAPVAERLGDIAADLLAAEVLEETPPHLLADLCLLIGDEVLGDAAHDLRNLVLPLLIPCGHLNLAARQ